MVQPMWSTQLLVAVAGCKCCATTVRACGVYNSQKKKPWGILTAFGGSADKCSWQELKLVAVTNLAAATLSQTAEAGR